MNTEYSPMLSHALYKIIWEVKQYLLERREEPLSIDDDVETPEQAYHAFCLQQEAEYILHNRLQKMLDDISVYDRKEVGGCLELGSRQLFKLVTIEDVTFYTDADIFTYASQGVYHIALYPMRNDTRSLNKKIPAILFVGDYRYLKCFDDAKYLICAYPGCFFTSTRGVIWKAQTVEQGRFFDLIRQSIKSFR